MLNYRKKEGHNGLLKNVSKLADEVKGVGYTVSKEEAILGSLRALKGLIEEDESVYEKKIRTKKRINLFLAILLIILCGLVFVEAFFNILPTWITDNYGAVLVIDILAIWFVNPDKR